MTKSIPRNKLLRPKLPDRCWVKVIGLGGVGSIVARYAACFLASMQKDCLMSLVDGDQFEPSNAARMIFGDFGNKAFVVRDELLPRFRESRLLLLSHPQYVTRKNIKRLIREKDIVLLCVDNHATRKLVDRHCAKLKNVCLISGGNDGIGEDSTGTVRQGTYGNVQIYIRKNGKDVTPRLSAYHPEIAKPKDKMPDQLSCTDLVVSTPQILFSNLTVASSMLNTLLLYLSDQLPYSEMGFDISKGKAWPSVPNPLPSR